MDVAVEQHAGGEEEQVAALLVATAGTLLESQGTGAPKAFVDALFGLTVPEDVVRYDAREVAALAEAAWGFLAERKPGASKIRLETPAAAGERLTVSIGAATTPDGLSTAAALLAASDAALYDAKLNGGDRVAAAPSAAAALGR